MLLAIDTSAGTSVAVVHHDRGVLAEITETDSRRHAEAVGALMARCLKQAGVTPADLSGVAIGMGPGPFTGLRVGIAAGNAFAFGAEKPAIRLISHDAIAYAHYAADEAGPIVVVTDARRREVYWSTYGGVDEFGLPVRVNEPGLAKPGDLVTAVPEYEKYTRLDAPSVSAGALGLLAAAMSAEGRPFAGPEPLYLRSPDVTVSAGPKRVS